MLAKKLVSIVCIFVAAYLLSSCTLRLKCGSQGCVSGLPIESSAKDITAFSVSKASGVVSGEINEAGSPIPTILLVAPYGTKVTRLQPAISITGASVSPASLEASNFTDPVTYTVTAKDGSTKKYKVYVAVPPYPRQTLVYKPLGDDLNITMNPNGENGQWGWNHSFTVTPLELNAEDNISIVTAGTSDKDFPADNAESGGIGTMLWTANWATNMVGWGVDRNIVKDAVVAGVPFSGQINLKVNADNILNYTELSFSPSSTVPWNTVFNLSLTKYEVWSGATPCTVVDFPDAELAAAVKSAIGTSGNICREDLEALTYLSAYNASGTHISDLTGLHYCTHLTHLDLGNNNNTITDISELSGLTSLTVLYLYTNNITDISPLHNMTHLTLLNIGNNRITDLSPLAGLTSLTNLDIGCNINITDISPLAGLTGLTTLHFNSNNISDISAVSGMTSLTELWMDYNNIGDISALMTNRFTNGGLTGAAVKIDHNPLNPQALVDVQTLFNSGVNITW